MRCAGLIQRADLRNELSILRFAEAFLKKWKKGYAKLAIRPRHISFLECSDAYDCRVKGLEFDESGLSEPTLLYTVPEWCDPNEGWRFQLGFLLRYILTGKEDFTRSVRSVSWKEMLSSYRPAESHWLQRRYGLHNAQSAFGDDWLPITDWLESFLFSLLLWPGCQVPEGFGWVYQDIQTVIAEVQQRVEVLCRRRGVATDTLILPIKLKRPSKRKECRALRACIVQTIIPQKKDFCILDLELNRSDIRQKHRSHLTSTIAAVKRMLCLRNTHTDKNQRLDLLILPELAVHPADIRTCLIPFARAHRTIILAGLTYQKPFANQPLINSALWIIPELSDAYGLQARIFRQGKQYLAPYEEEKFNVCGSESLRGFRPCQWLIGYPWAQTDQAEPVWMTASICYDATDLRLAGDLRNQSDIFVIPAFNQDVKTFDNMALALHYHMYQLVIVANNGEYGGSSAYWPKGGEVNRQIFHLHGQPQASIAFLDIENIREFKNRPRMNKRGRNKFGSVWKHPPAGWPR